MQKPSGRSRILLYPSNSMASGLMPLASSISVRFWLRGGLASKQQPPFKWHSLHALLMASQMDSSMNIISRIISLNFFSNVAIRFLKISSIGSYQFIQKEKRF
jgi:hypothetical protein